mmetsp:Transcript_2176/g.3144  ORF Transcript_2176/g.3144 Transcript_2176/m.3144 type:complete len:93 (-) Transcript_2176:80-358(-)
MEYGANGGGKRKKNVFLDMRTSKRAQCIEIKDKSSEFKSSRRKPNRPKKHHFHEAPSQSWTVSSNVFREIHSSNFSLFQRKAQRTVRKTLLK